MLQYKDGKFDHSIAQKTAQLLISVQINLLNILPSIFLFNHCLEIYHPKIKEYVAQSFTHYEPGLYFSVSKYKLVQGQFYIKGFMDWCSQHVLHKAKNNNNNEIQHPESSQQLKDLNARK